MNKQQQQAVAQQDSSIPEESAQQKKAVESFVTLDTPTDTEKKEIITDDQ
jgi:hypothetical protein